MPLKCLQGVEHVLDERGISKFHQWKKQESDYGAGYHHIFDAGRSARK